MAHRGRKKVEKQRDNRIVELMKERGLSYRELEQLSGVPYATLHKVANHTFEGAQVRTIKAIAYGLGVEIAELFLLEDNQE